MLKEHFYFQALEEYQFHKSQNYPNVEVKVKIFWEGSKSFKKCPDFFEITQNLLKFVHYE